MAILGRGRGYLGGSFSWGGIGVGIFGLVRIFGKHFWSEVGIFDWQFLCGHLDGSLSGSCADIWVAVLLRIFGWQF